jgi:hypothetical protein
MGHDSGYHGFRPRLQRRDRDGLAPSSLLNPHAYGYLNPLVIKEPTISLSEHLPDQHPVSKLDALFEAWTVHRKNIARFLPYFKSCVNLYEQTTLFLFSSLANLSIMVSPWPVAVSEPLVRPELSRQEPREDRKIPPWLFHSTATLGPQNILNRRTPYLNGKNS